MTRAPSEVLCRGRTRAEDAAALREYRLFIATHPESELVPTLQRATKAIRGARKRRREADRLTGVRA